MPNAGYKTSMNHGISCKKVRRLFEQASVKKYPCIWNVRLCLCACVCLSACVCVYLNATHCMHNHFAVGGDQTIWRIFLVAIANGRQQRTAIVWVWLWNANTWIYRVYFEINTYCLHTLLFEHLPVFIRRSPLSIGPSKKKKTHCRIVSIPKCFTYVRAPPTAADRRRLLNIDIICL